MPIAPVLTPWPSVNLALGGGIKPGKLLVTLDFTPAGRAGTRTLMAVVRQAIADGRKVLLITTRDTAPAPALGFRVLHTTPQQLEDDPMSLYSLWSRAWKEEPYDLLAFDTLSHTEQAWATAIGFNSGVNPGAHDPNDCEQMAVIANCDYTLAKSRKQEVAATRLYATFHTLHIQDRGQGATQFRLSHPNTMATDWITL